MQKKGESMSRSPVLFLLNSLSLGGSESKTVKICNSLKSRGWDIHLGYLGGPETLKKGINESVKVVNFNRKLRLDPFAIKRINKYINSNDIGIIASINLYSTIYGIIVSRHGKTCISFINKTNFYSTYDNIKMYLYSILLEKADCIVFGCNSQKELWFKKYGIDKTRSIHIYNGVDCSYFSPECPELTRSSNRYGCGIGENEVVIVNVSRFSRKKNQEDLLAACAGLMDLGYPVRVAFAGDGPEMPRVRGLAREKGVTDKVLFLGEVPDVRPLLAASDIFVLPSAADTFSNATLEAMAMEKPVILADVAGASEMVVHGRNGFLYPASDIGQLVGYLKQLIENREQRIKMGRESRIMAQTYFGFDRMIENYETLLHAAANSLKFVPITVTFPGYGNDDL